MHLSRVWLCVCLCACLACGGEGATESESQLEQTVKPGDNDAELPAGLQGAEQDAAGSEDAASMSPGGGGGAAGGGGAMDAGGADMPASTVGASAFGSAPYARINSPARRLLFAAREFCVVLADRSLHCGDTDRPGDYGFEPPRGTANADLEVIIRPQALTDLLGIRSDGSVLAWNGGDGYVDDLQPEGTGHISAARNRDTVCGLRATGELNCLGEALSAEVMAGRYVQIALTNVEFVGLGVDGHLYSSTLAQGAALQRGADDRKFVSFEHGARPGCGVDTAGALRCAGGPQHTGWGVHEPLGSEVRDYDYRGGVALIRADGKIEFRPEADGSGRVVEVMPERTFVDVGHTSSSQICGVTVEGELWCWDDRDKESWQVPLPMAAATSD